VAFFRHESGLQYREQEQAMTKLKVLAATAALLSMAGNASAADVYHDGGSMKDAPYIAPAPTWDGFYIGVGGGASAAKHDGTVDGGVFDGTGAGIPIFPLFDNLADVGTVSGFGTVQVGLDRQRGSWVFGLFADYDWMNMDSDIGGNSVDLAGGGGPAGLVNVNLSAEVDNMWSVGGRIGFLTSPSTLVYGLLAYSQADITAIADVSFSDGAGNTIASVTDKGDGSVSGFTIGAGIETKLAENVSLKLEYRYTDLDNANVSSDGFVLPGVFAVGPTNLDLDTDIHSVRAVLAWRPDWGGHDILR
jgi:outer membrane immunogenic protein